MRSDVHGGTDAGPALLHDFSTNANPLPAPAALVEALQQADRRRYPDPQYLALRLHLAGVHGVAPAQVLPASGGAEAIRRLSLMALLRGLREVWVPDPGFGDYAAAAQALGLPVRSYASVQQLLDGLGRDALVWICEPCNPTGASLDSADIAAIAVRAALTVLDLAYEPLRLAGAAPAIPPHCWQLHCPNKALGHTGVRAAYLLAPDEAQAASVDALAASWVLSAEGQALLMQLHRPEIQAWLAHSRKQLRQWSAQQRAMLAGLGWQQRESCTPFWLARPPTELPELRARRIKLRDAASFGLPGWVRVSTLPPQSQLALQKVIAQ
jgi:histidinol-phosphate aminotransferase